MHRWRLSQEGLAIESLFLNSSFAVLRQSIEELRAHTAKPKPIAIPIQQIRRKDI
jgi:hypothetical protein